MAAGDRGRRGRGTYGDRSKRDRGTSRRDSRSGEDKNKKGSFGVGTGTGPTTGGMGSGAYGNLGSISDPAGGQTPDTGGMGSGGYGRSSFTRAGTKGGRTEAEYINRILEAPTLTMADQDLYTGSYGTFKGISEQLAEFRAAKAEDEADAAWGRGDYLGYVSSKLSALGENVEAGIRGVQREFTQAPLDALEGAISNPLVQAGLMATGFAAAIPAVGLLDAALDAYQGEATPAEALQQAAGTAIGYTPVGEVLGPFQGVASEAVANIQKAPETVSGFVGGTIGGKFGVKLGGLTRNPYATAAIGAIGGVVGRVSAASAATAPSTGVSPSKMGAPARDSKADTPVSSLVSTGKEAVAASQRLMQPAQANIYAQSVSSLPFYGLSPDSSQLPYYGFA